MQTLRKCILGLGIALVSLTLNASTATAQVLTTYVGKGLNGATGDSLQFSAVISVINGGTSSSQLQIKLINNTTGTNGRGDLLSGMFFNLSGVTSTPTSQSSAGVTASLVLPVDSGQTSLVINSNNTAASSQAVNGSFAFQDLRGISGTQYQFGVNASGFSNSGGTPNYSFSGQTLGGGGDDYLIRPNTANTINGGVVPLIKSEVILTLAGFGSSLTSVSQLSNVYFAVGSGAQSGGTLVGTQYVAIAGAQTPEPGSVGLMAAAGVSGLACLRRRKRAR